MDTMRNELETVEARPQPEAIDPAHYAELSPEPITVIEQWRLGFHEANALKYLARAGRKGGSTRADDLIKAANYCYRAATGRWLPKSILHGGGDDRA